MKFATWFSQCVLPPQAFNALCAVALLGLGLCSASLSGCLGSRTPVKAPEAVTEEVQWINTPSPEAVAGLIPAVDQTPVVMFVHADLCAACQTLKPKLRSVSKRFPHLPVLSINLNQKPSCEAGAKAYTGIMEGFSPAVTPTLVFMEQGGKVQAVVVDDQPEEALTEAFTALDATAKRPEGEAMPKAPPINPNTVLGC
jgi:thiol-disulfide isomerase/thioredoxin